MYYYGKGGDRLEAYEALREAANRAGIPLYKIGRALGKPDAYVNSAISRGSVPRCDTMAKMSDVVGYDLALVPKGEAPDSALLISVNSDS